MLCYSMVWGSGSKTHKVAKSCNVSTRSNQSFWATEISLSGKMKEKGHPFHAGVT